MDILKPIRKLIRREAAQAPAPALHTYNLSASEGVTIATPEQAIRISACRRCVNIIGSTVAKLPLEFKRLNKASGVFVDDIDNPLYYLLARRPSRWHTAYEFWDCIAKQMPLMGNAYVYIDRAGGEISQLILLSPHTVTYDERTDFYTVNDFMHGVQGVFPSSEILHFSNGSIDGSRIGVSSIAQAATTLSIQATADKETLSRFSSGGKIKALLSNDTSVTGFGEYDGDEMDKLAAKLERKLATNDIVSTPGDAKIHQLNMSSSDLQFLESRKFGVIEICRAFGVPPSKIYAEYNHAYNAGETANVEFLVDSIDPILTKIEQELEAKLIGDLPVMFTNYRVLFDREKMFTVNSITKADYYNKMLQVGAWAVNDIRQKENMPSVNGGDRVLVTCNVAPVDSAKISGEEKKAGNQ
jgi:HK97 family phage portal protein